MTLLYSMSPASLDTFPISASMAMLKEIQNIVRVTDPFPVEASRNNGIFIPFSLAFFINSEIFSSIQSIISYYFFSFMIMFLKHFHDTVIEIS